MRTDSVYPAIFATSVRRCGTASVEIVVLQAIGFATGAIDANAQGTSARSTLHVGDGDQFATKQDRRDRSIRYRHKERDNEPSLSRGSVLALSSAAGVAVRIAADRTGRKFARHSITAGCRVVTVLSRIDDAIATGGSQRTLHKRHRETVRETQSGADHAIRCDLVGGCRGSADTLAHWVRRGDLID